MGKNDLLLHFVESHKQAVSVHLAYKLQAAVATYADADGSYASLHLLVNEDKWPMEKVAQATDPFEQITGVSTQVFR